MRGLNYHHLYYFWVTARLGSLRAAAQRLHLAPQTMSDQIKLLEERLHHPLFERQGRRLVLTVEGHQVFAYASRMFAIGEELASLFDGKRQGSWPAFRIGITDALPKRLVQQWLSPLFALQPNLSLSCQEGAITRLLGQLGVHELDAVLSEVAYSAGLDVQARSYPLLRSQLAFFAAPSLLEQTSLAFPACLGELPLLLPDPEHPLHAQLLGWLHDQGITPWVRAEVRDSGLMQVMAEAGDGVMSAPTQMSSLLARRHDLTLLGECSDLYSEVFLILPGQRNPHPAAEALLREAESASHALREMPT
ncbi:MAG: LysR substrate-binding domain-containing protein [Aeromonadaceae bacterium]